MDTDVSTVARNDEDLTEDAPATGAKAVENVTNGSTLASDLSEATRWFLSDEDSDAAKNTFQLNVGSEREHFVNWTVCSISRERIRQIRRTARVRRRGAQEGEIDDVKANAQIAAEGSIDPDIAQIAVDNGIDDLAAVITRRFRHKPGLIDQIAGEVLTVSGYDDDDVRDVAVARDS